ncbi:GNAT family N-acetyltransferase [Amorphoplanes digitatis]|uniref:Putative acetyltransferase n=1 Tax=Actinoplanes digitatis TaxID=1868 RepID=A0A7W7I6J8_9ACTN|nr:N-acetyltransferase [Actinoplanes digitatis]MBB4767323.1 putative acetyltransferase [Actinoplanes digitatis]BFE67000.1 N-acetyltransferase [Actinoplanes digitatis]GID98551.1 N-acetyltransferase [Actinoplanes digitatis]
MNIETVRPERAEDFDAVRQVLLAAFETDGEARLVEALRRSDAFLPDLSVVAEHDGAVAAYALLSRITVGDDAGLALGPVAVLPDLQKRGLGAAVIREALRRAADAGERLVLVLGDPAYYGRFGFVPAAPYGITSEWSSFGDAWQVLALGTVEARYPAPWHDL